jgi:DNA-binding IscR family transcriptional regulator
VGTATFLQRFSWQTECRQKMALKRLSDAIQQAMKNFSLADLKAITE